MSNTDANKSNNQHFSAAIGNAAFGEETGYGGRVLRGWSIGEKNKLRMKADGSFLVPSDTDPNQKYNVKLNSATDRFTCECDDFKKNHPTNPLHYCKHIFGVISWITSNSVLLELLKGEEEKSFLLPHCPKCESSQVIRYGTDNQRKCFLCTSCGHRFRGQRLLHHGHYNEKIVSLSFDLYFSGLSYRAVAGIINKHFNMNIDHSTIVKWMDRLIPIVSEYVDSLLPHLSGVWQADELYAGVTEAERLGKGKWKGKRIAYLWDVMDRGTRMLLASMLYRFRDSIGAKKAFEKAIATSQEQVLKL